MTLPDPDSFPSWTPLLLTFGGLLLLGFGIFGWLYPAKDPLPGRELTHVKMLAIGGVLLVAGIIWWKKSNEIP